MAGDNRAARLQDGKNEEFENRLGSLAKSARLSQEDALREALRFAAYHKREFCAFIHGDADIHGDAERRPRRRRPLGINLDIIAAVMFLLSRYSLGAQRIPA